MKFMMHHREKQRCFSFPFSLPPLTTIQAGKLPEQHNTAEMLMYETIREGSGVDYQQEKFSPGGCNTADPDFGHSASYWFTEYRAAVA